MGYDQSSTKLDPGPPLDLPQSPSKVKKLIDGVQATPHFSRDAFLQLHESLMGILGLYSSSATHLFHHACVPNDATAPLISVADLLQNNRWREDQRTVAGDHASHYIKLSQPVTNFLRIIFTFLLPMEVRRWSEFDDNNMLMVYYRFKRLSIGSREQEERDLFDEVQRAMRVAYTPDTLRSTVMDLYRAISDLTAHHGGPRADAVWRDATDYLIRNGHPSMETHLVNTGIDPLKDSFDIDSLAASFKRASHQESTQAV